jgi:hypothetical protein
LTAQRGGSAWHPHRPGKHPEVKLGFMLLLWGWALERSVA